MYSKEEVNILFTEIDLKKRLSNAIRTSLKILLLKVEVNNWRFLRAYNCLLKN